MSSHLAYLNFINLPVCKSYTLTDVQNPSDELDDDECWTSSLLHGVLCVVTPKTVVSNDNILS